MLTFEIGMHTQTFGTDTNVPTQLLTLKFPLDSRYG